MARGFQHYRIVGHQWIEYLTIELPVRSSENPVFSNVPDLHFAVSMMAVEEVEENKGFFRGKLQRDLWNAHGIARTVLSKPRFA